MKKLSLILIAIILVTVGLLFISMSNRDRSSDGISNNKPSFIIKGETDEYIYGLTADREVIFIEKSTNNILYRKTEPELRNILLTLLPEYEYIEAYRNSEIISIYLDNKIDNIFLDFGNVNEQNRIGWSGYIVAIDIETGNVRMAGYFESDVIEYEEDFVDCCG